MEFGNAMKVDNKRMEIITVNYLLQTMKLEVPRICA